MFICPQNFISASTVRDITSLRQEFLSTLTSLNLVPPGSTPLTPALNTHSAHTGLVKAVVLAGLWPRVARVALPKGAIKFDRVQAGTVQRANEAREYKFYDVRVGDAGGRVFVHPASVLFRAAEWKSPFVAYFQKQQTTKLFLRDATEVSKPLWSIGVSMLTRDRREGSNICDALVRRAGLCKPRRRRPDDRQQGCLREVESLAAHWSVGQPATVRRYNS